MRQTREELQARADQAVSENTLLIQYVSDVENGIRPSAVEREGHGEGRVEGKLYRPTAGHGGIAVLKFRAGDSWDVHVYALEDISWKFEQDHSVHSLNVRVVLSRLRLARNRAFETPQVSVAA